MGISEKIIRSMVNTPQELPFDPNAPSPFDEHLVIHPHRVKFTDTPAFIVLFLACVAVVGSLIGLLLALDSISK